MGTKKEHGLEIELLPNIENDNSVCGGNEVRSKRVRTSPMEVAQNRF